MARVVYAVLLGALLALAPARGSAQWGMGFDDAEDWTLKLTASRVQHSLDGDFALGGEVLGSPLDVDGLLDLEETEEFAGMLELKGLGQRLRLSYTPIEFEGETDLTSTVFVFGVPFSVGNRVESGLDFRSYELTYRYGLNITRFVTITPILGMSLLEGKARVENLSVPGTIFDEDVLQPIPLIGARLEIRPLPRISLFAEARGFTANSFADFADIRIGFGEAGVSLVLSKHLVLTGRYQIDEYDFTATDIDFDLRRESFSFDIEIRF